MLPAGYRHRGNRPAVLAAAIVGRSPRGGLPRRWPSERQASDPARARTGRSASTTSVDRGPGSRLNRRVRIRGRQSVASVPPLWSASCATGCGQSAPADSSSASCGTLAVSRHGRSRPASALRPGTRVGQRERYFILDHSVARPRPGLRLAAKVGALRLPAAPPPGGGGRPLTAAPRYGPATMGIARSSNCASAFRGRGPTRGARVPCDVPGRTGSLGVLSVAIPGAWRDRRRTSPHGRWRWRLRLRGTASGRHEPSRLGAQPAAGGAAQETVRHRVRQLGWRTIGRSLPPDCSPPRATPSCRPAALTGG